MHEQFDNQAYADFVGDDGPRLSHYEIVIERLGLYNLNHVSILDIGCGSGNFSELLNAKFSGKFQLAGFDPSPVLIKEAQDKNIPGTEFVVCSTAEFSTDKRFDSAVSILVLPYADTKQDLKDIFEAAAKHLDQGKPFIAVTFNPAFCIPSEQVLANRRFEPMDENELSIHFLSREGKMLFRSRGRQWSLMSLENAARDAGFSSMHWQTMYLDYNGRRISGKNIPEQNQPYGILECIR